MVTINELIDAKTILNEACETLTSEINDLLSDQEGKRIFVCYHSHHETPTFSIYHIADNSTKEIHLGPLVFLVDPSVSEERLTPLMEEMVASALHKEY